jgi:hypothetical protein
MAPLPLPFPASHHARLENTLGATASSAAHPSTVTSVVAASTLQFVSLKLLLTLHQYLFDAICEKEVRNRIVTS